MNKMFFLVRADGDFHDTVLASSNLQCIIDCIKSLAHENYRIYTSCDFLNVRFLDNKIFID